MHTDTTSPHSSGGRRRHRKKDAALELPDLDQISSQDENHERPAQSDRQASMLQELISTPFLMISFLLSLLYVDREQRLWRVAQHRDSDVSLWNKLSIWSWFDPQPYQEPSDTTWQHGVPSSHAPMPTRPAWFNRKKHRKMFSMEFHDALQIRGRVMIFMIVWLAILIALCFWTAQRLFSWYKT